MRLFAFEEPVSEVVAMHCNNLSRSLAHILGAIDPTLFSSDWV